MLSLNKVLSVAVLVLNLNRVYSGRSGMNTSLICLFECTSVLIIIIATQTHYVQDESVIVRICRYTLKD